MVSVEKAAGRVLSHVPINMNPVAGHRGGLFKIHIGVDALAEIESSPGS
jgi:hypothetical protein